MNKTEMIFIIDESGSMIPLKNDTIGGFNSLIEEQKKKDLPAKVTLVFFNNNIKTIYDRVDIKDIKPLVDTDYTPLGTTAMLDAIGDTIGRIKQKLQDEPDEESNIVFTIITDGHENASKQYSLATIKQMISEQREKQDWVFTFIGANIDNMEVSNNLGIDPLLSKKYSHSKIGTQSVYTKVSESLNVLRDRGVTSSSTNDISKILDEVK